MKRSDATAGVFTYEKRIYAIIGTAILLAFCVRRR